jgi:probable ribonuclease FAU-1
MGHGVKIRGIYTTALTKLLLNAGYTIVDPSPEIQERFSLRSAQESPDILIQDREDHQGIDIVGESYLLTLLVRLLQETLMDAILLQFAALSEARGEREEDEEEEPKDIARARFEFPGTSKAYLDAVRSTVIPTLAKHHRLRIIQSRKVERCEEKWLGAPGSKEGTEAELFAEMVLAPLRKAGVVRLEHVKASGKTIRPREGVLLESSGERLNIKRSFSQGRYDGLDLPIEPGDYGLTEAREGAWQVKHAYYSKRGKLKGEYFNINTPVELYPFGARYVDLEIDVIRRAGEKPIISDREELAVLVRKGVIGKALEKKALETAEKVRESL